MNFLTEHALDIIVITLSWATLGLPYCLHRLDKKRDELFKAMADHARECLHGWGKAIHIKEQYKDAAEFEARVAKKLARRGPFFLHCDSRCPWYKQDTKDTYSCIHEYAFGFCRLREARIAVEEEMDV